MTKDNIEKSIGVNRKIYWRPPTEISVALPLMEKEIHPIGARVRARREEIGLSQTDLAKVTGYKQAHISDIEAGLVKRPGKLREMAKALRASEDYLLGYIDLFRETEERGSEDDAGSSAKHGIQEIELRAGMGGGGYADREVRTDGHFTDPVKDETWRFPTRFMREEIRAPESRVIIIETQGDSMSPTILSGDRVIVDTGHRLPSPDGIYALRDQYGGMVVKRLQLLRRGDPPRIKIISDNEHHPDEEVGADEIEIVGRVLWGLKRL